MMPLARGDDEPLFGGHRPANSTANISGIIGPGARRAEDRPLVAFAIGREDFERVAQFAQRAAEDLQVAARGLVLLQLVGRFFDRVDQIGYPILAGSPPRLLAGSALRIPA